MAKLVFLGTGAALPARDRANTALAITGDDLPSSGGLLIDCGGDIYSALLRADIGPDALSDLFITHAHIDHIGALPSLIESLRLGGRTVPLRIWALPQVLEVARRLVGVFGFELTLDSWSFAVTFSPVEDGQELTLAGIEARIAAMDHSIPSAGLRLRLPGGDVTYTSDTQPTASIRTLGQGTRMLITECTYPRAWEAGARMSKHMTAPETGKEAANCGAQTLALVHRGPWPDEEIWAEVAEHFAGTILLPKDGDAIEV